MHKFFNKKKAENSKKFSTHNNYFISDRYFARCFSICLRA